MGDGQTAPVRPPFPRRITAGIGATIVTLLLIVFPGQMVLPLTALLPLMPHMGGCANFAGPIVGLAFFGLAILLSGFLIVVGILAIVFTALRNRVGLAGSIALNGVVASLLLMSPLDVSSAGDPGVFGLYALLDVCALVPLTALVLLLSPKVFGTWFHSGRSFVAALVAAGLLLLPGAAGTVAFGDQLLSTHSSQPATTPTSTHSAAC